MSLYFGNSKSANTFKETVSLFSAKDFQSPTRSTIPMLSMLIHQREIFDQVVRDLGLPPQNDVYIEYTVRPPVGIGKASHTDVLVRAGREALAVEAKWTEPMYDTVRKWISKGKDESNRRLVLDGWLQLLQKSTRKNLKPFDFEQSIYQMVHRAASAAVAGERPRLAYFLFKPSHDRKAASTDAIRNRLDDLWTSLGSPPDFPFSVVEITLSEKEAYRPLKSLPKCQATANAVREVLQGESPPFGFSVSKIIKIGGATT